jgi:uncharacterized protein YkwD
MKFLKIAISLIFFCVSTSFMRNDELRKDILRYTNEFRSTNHLPELFLNGDLNDLAEKHSKNMASHKVPFGHDGFDERSAKVRKKLNTWDVAENVAYGVSTGKEVVHLWQSSPGHRRNMLGNYKYIGIGTAKDRDGTIYFTEIFAR